MLTGLQLFGIIIVGTLFIYCTICKICDTIAKVKTADKMADIKCIKVGSKEELEQVLRQIEEIEEGDEE